jgi:hypothetical protein
MEQTSPCSIPAGRTGRALDRIHVISTPVPPVRLLRSVEARLKGLYDALLEEPVPPAMLDLIVRHERSSRSR